MSIVSSIFALIGPPQRDGRQYVRETHTDNAGVAHVAEYLAVAGADYAAIMTARAVVVAAQLVEAEIANWMARDDGPVIVLVYATKVQFAAPLRRAYLISTKLETAR